MKKHTTRLLISVIALLAAVAPFADIYAQETYFHRTPVYQFDLPGSLRGNEVQNIFQDSRGFMWFGSKNGLLRYDGSRFKTYRNRVSDSTSISFNEIEKIIEGTDGFLYVSTWGGGFNKYNPRTEEFTRYRHDANDANSVCDDFITDMVQDENGRIWLATRGGLSRFDPRTERFKNYYAEAKNERSLSYHEVRTVYLDRAGTLWVGTGYPWEEGDRGGLCRYNAATDDFTQIYENGVPAANKARVKVASLYEDSRGNFWVGGNYNRVFLLDRRAEKLTLQPDLSAFEIKEDTPHIRSFFEVEPGRIYICSYGAGLRLFDVATRKILDETYVIQKNSNNFFYPFNHAWQLYKSRDGTLWFCTGDIGEKVYKSDNLLSFFGMVNKGDEVQSVHVDKDERLWFGRHYNGIQRVNWNDWNEWDLTYQDDPKNPLPGNRFSQERRVDDLFDDCILLHSDRDNVLYFTKNEAAAGLWQLDPKTGTLRTYTHDPSDPLSIGGNNIIDLAVAPDGKTVWTTDRSGFLNKFDPAMRTFERFSAAQSRDCPRSPGLLKFSEAGDLLIFGIEDEAEVRLTKFDPKTKRFTPLILETLSQPDDRLHLTGLTEDADGRVWAATERVLYSVDKNEVVTRTEFTEDETGQAVAMLADARGSLWFSTTTGISVYNPDLGEFYDYSTESQLLALPFAHRSAARIADEMLFCGDGGCMYVNRRTIDAYYSRQKNPATLDPAKIVLTGFTLNGERDSRAAFTPDSLQRGGTLTLTHEENNFSLAFSLLDYQRPADNRFEYFLENYDTYWRAGGESNSIFYAQIPPGTYTLRVRGFNSAGESAEITPLSVRISPPWWRTGWAYGLYAAAFFGLLYAVYRFQLRKSLAEAEAVRLQDLDAAKSRLYTNITHEFRTPLTVILGMAKQMQGQLTESQSRMAEMISRNGQNLLNLVNQMLDLAKLESGQMKLDLQQGDLISYLKYLTESFHSFAESRDVKVHFLSDLESQNMDFDPQKVQQIISNLLSNAIKFTPAGGDIYISVNPATEADKMLSVRIKDTGTGIAPERLPYIFERFYQADESQTREYEGTGIGLALTAELVKLMQGQISVKSDLGKGTEFTLLLPVAQTAAQNTDLSYYDRAKLQFHREGIADDLTEKPLAPAVIDTQKPTILVAEDNFDVRTYISACLSEKYHLIMAENGQRGSEKAIEHTPDLIISDIMMPLKDGYTLARELKADARTSHIPVVLLTAKADTDSRLTGLKQGADAYLAKPFNPEELLIRIEKLLELRRKLQQHYLGLERVPAAQTVVKETAPEDEFVLRVKSVVEDHIDDYNLDVQMLCREIGMSHSQLHRKLSALTGLSVNKYVRFIRLERAKDLLRNPEQSVTATAFETGYNDPSYFGRVFKKETGMTPVEWQQGGGG